MLHMGPCQGSALGSDRWWAVIQYCGEERQQRFVVGVVVRRWYCGILALWKLCGFVGLIVHFLWSVNIRSGMGVLEVQDGAVVGMARRLPSSLASSPLRIL